ncbi:MAG: site-specific DNA-methyltransferase [Clostridia bacterium]|nr:site-specific DNA-methyltransferase [Clostridia bacterium]
MKSERNKTLTIESLANKKNELLKNVIFDTKTLNEKNITNKLICGDTLKIIKKLPDNFVDLLITDPPYNLTKHYNDKSFNRKDDDEYEIWLDKWMSEIPRIMKPTGSLYFCGDFRSTPLYYNILKKYFYIQNRITWERDKGRGAKKNWKNNIEDIFFCTMNSDDYTFNLQDVKVKKKVIAPYKDENGNAKDWFVENGEKYRYTCPSNVWTDITVPYWSMSENTEHPTQKPEKLIKRLITASSNEGDFVLDLFAGSGTTLVSAFSMNRRYCGIELDEGYCMLTEERLNRLMK